MPLVTIWRNTKLVSDEKAIAIRDVLLGAVQTALDVQRNEVEVRVRDIGPLDINYMPIGIEIDTGTGKGGWRVKKKKSLAKKIAGGVYESNVLEPEWIGLDKSYVWIRICESSFVPIGHADHAR